MPTFAFDLCCGVMMFTHFKFTKHHLFLQGKWPKPRVTGVSFGNDGSVTDLTAVGVVVVIHRQANRYEYGQAMPMENVMSRLTATAVMDDGVAVGKLKIPGSLEQLLMPRLFAQRNTVVHP